MVRTKKGVEELFASLGEINGGGLDVKMVWKVRVTASCLDFQCF